MLPTVHSCSIQCALCHRESHVACIVSDLRDATQRHSIGEVLSLSITKDAGARESTSAARPAAARHSSSIAEACNTHARPAGKCGIDMSRQLAWNREDALPREMEQQSALHAEDADLIPEVLADPECKPATIRNLQG